MGSEGRSRRRLQEGAGLVRGPGQVGDDEHHPRLRALSDRLPGEGATSTQLRLALAGAISGLLTGAIAVFPPVVVGQRPVARRVRAGLHLARLKGPPHPDGVLMEIIFETGVKTGEARVLTGK